MPNAPCPMPIALRNLQQTHLNRARASLSVAVSWYGNLRKPGQSQSNLQLAGLVKPELEVLTATLNKLDYNVIRIAAFGLVSRGKSAVLNALLGQKILQTGPLHGVTQYPRSVSWNPGGKVQVELIDTPGLDEIAGEIRGQMAREVAQQADLIL
ncbi:Era-like GTP-binding protein, partial [Aetokthonos hydrillicola]